MNDNEHFNEGNNSPTSASGSSGSSKLLILLFSFPIWLPILIVAVSLLFALFVVFVAFVFSMGIASVALVITGVIGVVVFPVLIIKDFGLAMYFGGIGLAALGFGIFTIQFFKLLINWFPKISLFTNRIIRRGK